MLEPDDSTHTWREDRIVLDWPEILAILEDEELQKGHDSKIAKAFWDRSARGCTKCDRPAQALAWIYYSTIEKDAFPKSGRAGWVVVCMDCQRQADFILTMIV